MRSRTYQGRLLHPAVAWYLAATLLTGCGGIGGPQRRPVFGTVTDKRGDPIDGTISFQPAKGHEGVAANGAILDGEFRFDTITGPVSGPHVVLITLDTTLNSKANGLDQIAQGKAPAAVERGSGKLLQLTADVPAEAPFEVELKLPE